MLLKAALVVLHAHARHPCVLQILPLICAHVHLRAMHTWAFVLSTCALFTKECIATCAMHNKALHDRKLLHDIRHVTLHTGPRLGRSGCPNRSDPYFITFATTLNKTILVRTKILMVCDKGKLQARHHYHSNITALHICSCGGAVPQGYPSTFLEAPAFCDIVI